MKSSLLALAITTLCSLLIGCKTSTKTVDFREPKVGTWDFWLVLKSDRPVRDILMFYGLENAIAVYYFDDSGRINPPEFISYFPLKTNQEKEDLHTAYEEIKISVPIETYGEGYTYKESYVYPYDVSIGTLAGADIEFRKLTKESKDLFQSLFDEINQITKDKNLELSTKDLADRIQIIKSTGEDAKSSR